MEITINTSRCYERGKQWNDNSHISLKVTVSHMIVILFNPHLSRAFLTCLNPLLRVYINQYFSMHLQFQLVQQCIQLSTRINSSNVHTYICVCFIRDNSSR